MDVRSGHAARRAAEQKEDTNARSADPQQLQTKFQQVKPQLKQRFSGVTDQDLDAWRNDRTS